jgi:hypothetical protein
VHHHGATVAAGAGVTASRHNAELLWADLVRWVRKERGPSAARRAARWMAAGGLAQRLLLRLEARGASAAQRQALRAAAARAHQVASSPQG